MAMKDDPIISAINYCYPGYGEAAERLGIVPQYWALIVAGRKPFHPRLRTIARYLLAFGPLPPDASLAYMGDAPARPYASGKPRKERKDAGTGKRARSRRRKQEDTPMG